MTCWLEEKYHETISKQCAKYLKKAISRLSPSQAKATRKLGYNPWSFEDTVRDSLAWFAEAGMLEEPFSAPEAFPAG